MKTNTNTKNKKLLMHRSKKFVLPKSTTKNSFIKFFINLCCAEKAYKNGGITIIETIVAIVVLASSFVAGEYFLMAALSSNQTTKTRFVATYLAQECLELARNVRDSSWQQKLSGTCAFVAGEFSIAQNSINISAALPNCQMDLGIKITPFQVTDKIEILSQEIPFSRKMIVTPSVDDIKIECVVQGPKDVEVSMSEILTEWKK